VNGPELKAAHVLPSQHFAIIRPQAAPRAPHVQYFASVQKPPDVLVNGMQQPVSQSVSALHVARHPAQSVFVDSIHAPLQQVFIAVVQLPPCLVHGPVIVAPPLDAPPTPAPADPAAPAAPPVTAFFSCVPPLSLPQAETLQASTMMTVVRRIDAFIVQLTGGLRWIE